MLTAWEMVHVTLPLEKDLGLGFVMIPSWYMRNSANNDEVYIFGGMEKDSFVFELEKAELLPLCKASSRANNFVKILSRGKVTCKQ
jgi:hypothetical protein